MGVPIRDDMFFMLIDVLIPLEQDRIVPYVVQE